MHPGRTKILTKDFISFGYFADKGVNVDYTLAGHGVALAVGRAGDGGEVVGMCIRMLKSEEITNRLRLGSCVIFHVEL